MSVPVAVLSLAGASPYVVDAYTDDLSYLYSCRENRLMPLLVINEVFFLERDSLDLVELIIITGDTF